MRTIILTCSLLLLFSCDHVNQVNTPVIIDIPAGNQPTPAQNQQLTLKVFKNDTLKNGLTIAGFGYDIFRKNILFIHQPTIPAVGGNAGFSSAEKAEKTAKLMLYKIANNIMPPSVSIQELDSLGIFK